MVTFPTTADRSRHEAETGTLIARKLAAIKGFRFAGDFEASRRHAPPVYYVPDDTLVGAGIADELGIATENDLFGGIVPYAFVATKAISHPTVEPSATAPEGWSHEFGQRTRDAVLSGFTVFTAGDADVACRRLLADGPVRIKPVREKGGRGQTVVRTADELAPAISAIDPQELAACGLVLEENLERVETHSVGQVRVADLLVSYFGTQRLTRDNRGNLVYGGTDLLAAPGGFDSLLSLALPEGGPEAVRQAGTYDTAAMECFPGMVVSRRNYDVAIGWDARGRRRTGVLEQSWRMGGATGAELAVFEGFRADPSARSLRAATVELYGEGHSPPPCATVYFSGTDERVGPLLKYSMLGRHDDDQ
ncbi:DUF3182 family protein [Skermanella rosea]|uniref:DUF3182 family protein n=1 Tax=Skermanella rosea TaxID=1817965 RepID=UPI0019325E11|nr:DUF3182 family protein [Skermanella rosea]UEM06284.1 DUF3182 family protein [Skermanella rosea]